MEVISKAPEVSDFVPLIEHLSATPASFYSGPPVLHYYSQRCQVIVLEGDMNKSAAFQRLVQGAKRSNTNGNSSNGNDAEVSSLADEVSAQRVIDGIDVWVTSE